MILKVKHKSQRDIKRHIDHSLFQRKVRSVQKRIQRNLYKMLDYVKHKKVQNQSKENPKKKKKRAMPLFVCLEYDSVFDNRKNINPKDFLANIPTLQAIEFIVSFQNRVLYNFSDTIVQQKIIDEMCLLFHGTEATRIRNFATNQKKNGNYPYIMDNNSCFLFYMLALECHNEENRVLTNEDKRNIFKAYLYSAHIWLEKQQENIKGLNEMDLSLRVDIPIIEFKSYKDYKAQLYKAARFFLFCKNDIKFQKFSNWFFKDKYVKDSSEYLLKIFSLYSVTIKESSVYIRFDESQNSDLYFFDQYAINFTDCKNIWANKDMGYLRNHFLIKTIDPISNEIKYLLLNAMLLIDKLYQGMIFDFADCVIKHHGTNKNGKEFKNKADFNSFLGEEFSEKHILYDTMELAFPTNNYFKLKGEELKIKGIKAEPDYCLIHNQDMFLFEFKDITLGDSIKQSTDVNFIKNELLARICRLDSEKKKGAGQVLYNIDRIFNKQLLMEEVDISSIKNVFPIVVTTDISFSALGVSVLVKQEFYKLIQESQIVIENAMIWTPIILDFDTLFNLIISFRESTVSLEKILKDYIIKCSDYEYRMLPFNSYVKDFIKLPALKKEDVPILYGGLLNLVKNEICNNS